MEITLRDDFLRKRQYKKQREMYINQLIDIIENSPEYQDYIKSDERYRKWLQSKTSLKVWGFTFLDTYNNKAMNKLI